MTDIEKRTLIQRLEANATAYELLGEKELPLLLRRAVAALSPPDGYVLVPVEPTEAMLAEGYGWVEGPDLREAYIDMLTARPEAP